MSEIVEKTRTAYQKLISIECNNAVNAIQNVPASGNDGADLARMIAIMMESATRLLVLGSVNHKRLMPKTYDQAKMEYAIMKNYKQILRTWEDKQAAAAKNINIEAGQPVSKIITE